MKKVLHIVVILAVFGLAPFACGKDRTDRQPDTYREASALVLKWHELLLELERHTPGYRPPVSARMWSYVEITAWQAALPGIPEAADLGTFLTALPDRERYTGAFFLPASLNAAYAEMFRQFFPTAPPHFARKIEDMEAEYLRTFQKTNNPSTLESSVAYGKKTARAIWAWSATDTFGHQGHLYNYDRQYTSPDCSGCWQPAGKYPEPALLPHWGKSRSLLVPPSEVEVVPPLQYDTRPGSPFHIQAMEIFTLSQPMTNEYRWIAEFWSDDVPGLTVSPMGRWISIANQAVARSGLTLPQLLEMYVKAAVASADIMVICWKNKYDFNLERPESYLRKVVDPAWLPLHESPPFPAYPSGHAALGAAVTEVLTAFLGTSFPLTDRTHEGRTEFAGKPRTYQSFQEMAGENALSRMALGVHFRMDCDEGMRIGRLVGKRVAVLPLRKREARLSLGP